MSVYLFLVLGVVVGFVFSSILGMGALADLQAERDRALEDLALCERHLAAASDRADRAEARSPIRAEWN